VLNQNSDIKENYALRILSFIKYYE